MNRFAIGALMLIVAACGNAGEAAEGVPSDSVTADSVTADSVASDSAPSTAGCAHVVDATIERAGSGFTIAATISSADTGWDKYADAWEVRGPDGALYGERVLAHPHENEQPFTRSLSAVTIPDGVAEVTIAARDSVLGFCGDTFVLEVPGV
jgi:hypothetical protein